MYKNSASHSEQSECVASLAEKSEDVCRSFGYSDQDARSVALNNLRFIAYGTQLSLNLLDSWSLGDEAVRTMISQLIGLNSATPKSIQIAGESLHKTSKLSLILLGQFQIENCLCNLARELNVGSPNQGFYTLAGSLVSRLGLRSSIVDELNVAALIRNSLHRNGIHSGYQNGDTVVSLNNVNYEFRHLQKVSCATVEHIAHALESSVDNLATIFDTSAVRAISDPVMDHYAWEIATTP